MHFAQIKNPFPDITNPCGTTKIDATDCDPHLSELKTGSERFNIIAGKYMYLNGYEILITSANEGLLYLPLIQSRIPVEWSGLTVMASENGIYGCVTEGEARMQGSVTGAIGRDLHRQVMALLTQGAGSFSGKFGEALDSLKAAALNETVSINNIPQYANAVINGLEEWIGKIDGLSKVDTIPDSTRSKILSIKDKLTGEVDFLKSISAKPVPITLSPEEKQRLIDLPDYIKESIEYLSNALLPSNEGVKYQRSW
jgi:hypothetical protein